MTSLKMHTPDLSAQNVEKLLGLFPNVATETHDATGKLVRGIDFDLLRQELSSRIVEGPQERYRLDWPGKREAMLAANAPIAKTLRPCRDESVDFDTTKNLFIEGDNLDALKLLQETYLGKVKLIYIDPPYNTGNDFIYEDDFAEDADTYLKRSNQKDEQGNRLNPNLDTDGKYHSKWLSMMYPRIKIAKTLLHDNGVIFVSIDDNEVHGLKLLMDEVFGRDNFVATAIWEKADSPRNTARQFSEDHDYLLVYSARPDWTPIKLPRTEESNSIYTNPDGDERGAWLPGDPFANKPYSKGQYTVTGPTGRQFSPPPGRYWRISEEKLRELDKDGRIWWGPKKDARPSIKRYLTEVADLTPRTLWKKEDVGSNRTSKNELKSLFPDVELFDTPKPIPLIERMLQLSTVGDANDVVVDFFAGSGTSAHAVMRANSQDGGNRKYILVQIPEVLDSSEYKTIAEITKERIRRAGKKILNEWHIKQAAPKPQPDLLIAAEPVADSVNPPDVGFRVLKIDTSNFNESFYKKPDEVHQTELLDMVDNIKSDRSAEDLLFQVLLDWGVDLALPIVRETILGKTVYFVSGTALAACFDSGVDDALIREIAARKPLRVVFRDTSYASDDTKINAVQILAQLSPTTDVRTI
jgi:adenine-specific DNA-methyltransferase